MRLIQKIDVLAPEFEFCTRRPPTAAELLRAVAAARGWVVGNGLPDEARAGRLLLRDYTAGKLLFCEWPPPPFGPARADELNAELGINECRHGELEGPAEPREGEDGSSAEEGSAGSSAGAPHHVSVHASHVRGDAWLPESCACMGT